MNSGSAGIRFGGSFRCCSKALQVYPEMSVKIIIEPLAERHLAQAAQLERECFSDPWSLEGLRAELTNPTPGSWRRCLEKPWRATGLHAVCGEGYIANLVVARPFAGKG